jgi:hypothetical protein
VKRTIAISAVAMMAVSSMGVSTASADTTNASGHANAVAEAKALLAIAPTLAGATSSATAPVKILDKAPQRAAYNQLVQRAKFATINESWAKAYADLTASTPTGLVEQGFGRVDGPKPSDDEKYAVYATKTLPTGIAYTALIVSVAPDGAGKAAIGVYAQAVPQPARPARESVPTTLKHAHVAVRTRSGHLIRGNTVTAATAKQLVADFDALTVSPPGERSCPADFGRREIVTFRAHGHTIVATAGFCGFVDVTRDGHRLPTLAMSAKFGKDIAKDLAPAPNGNKRPKRPGSEHVPFSVHRVRLARSDKPFNKKTERRTVTGKQAARLVRSFDAMKTQPETYLRCDLVGGPLTTVTFRTAKHTWVVSESACTNILVKRDGKRLPTLMANPSWDKAVQHDLGS